MTIVYLHSTYHGTCTLPVASCVYTSYSSTLVRVQAHMLARIVVEIRAADIAVELEPQL